MQKFGGAAPLGAKIWYFKKSIWMGMIWPPDPIVSGPKFIQLFWPNAGEIAVDQILVRFLCTY